MTWALAMSIKNLWHRFCNVQPQIWNCKKESKNRCVLELFCIPSFWSCGFFLYIHGWILIQLFPFSRYGIQIPFSLEIFGLQKIFKRQLSNATFKECVPYFGLNVQAKSLLLLQWRKNKLMITMRKLIMISISSVIIMDKWGFMSRIRCS